MSAPAEIRPLPPRGVAGDFWGGLASMLVALPSALAFGVLVFTVLGPGYGGQGALAGLAGAAVLGIIAPLVGRTGGLISAPCAPAAAVLSAFAASLIAMKMEAPAILPLLAFTALLAGVLQILFGALGGGRLIKYIPYPVVSGYLSGVGVLIVLGQVPKLLGLSGEIPPALGLVSPTLWAWPGLCVGGATILLTLLAPRLTAKVPAVVFGLLGGLLTYLILAAFDPALRILAHNPLVVGPVPAGSEILQGMVRHLHSMSAPGPITLRLILIPGLTLAVLLSVDTLKTCVVLDALTRRRHDADRELVGQGVGNLLSSLAGGMPGSGTLGPTLVNFSSGGRTWRSGAVSGLAVAAAVLLLGRMIAWIPLAALAGILIVIAVRMFDWGMFRLLRHPSSRFDFAVIAGVVLTAVFADLMAASGVGMGFAVLLFIRDQIRGSVIRRKLYLNQLSSKTRRSASERAVLMRRGGEGVFCELQGNLFFGTTDQLHSQLEADLRTARFILLDMRRVLSLDYTAAHLFDQMREELGERGGRLLFSGMPSALLSRRDFQRYLTDVGLVRAEGGIRVSETLDGALEWMEDRILEEEGVRRRDDDPPLPLRQFDLFRRLDGAALAVLEACVSDRSVVEGGRIFSAGDPGDDLFLVRRGAVRLLMPLESGQRHHLATVNRGSFFGEMAFFDHGVRTADAEAKLPADLYVLSRAKFEEQIRAGSLPGLHVLERLAAALAHRLRETDAELRDLEER